MKLALALFGKPIVPGRVKTRLAPALGEAGAAALYGAFLEDVVARAGALAPPTLWVAGDPAHPSLPDLPRRAQEGRDLGARMEHALASGLARADAVLLVGTDVPTLPARLLRRAAAALRKREVVFAPSHDGGYVLVGARRPLRFGDVRWSSPHALADSLRAAPDAALVEPWYDVDTPRDLALLRAHLALDPAAAPRTARALRDLPHAAETRAAAAPWYPAAR